MKIIVPVAVVAIIAASLAGCTKHTEAADAPATQTVAAETTETEAPQAVNLDNVIPQPTTIEGVVVPSTFTEEADAPDAPDGAEPSPAPSGDPGDVHVVSFSADGGTELFNATVSWMKAHLPVGENLGTQGFCALPADEYGVWRWAEPGVSRVTVNVVPGSVVDGSIEGNDEDGAGVSQDVVTINAVRESGPDVTCGD